MKKPWCYLSGPYSNGDVAGNVNAAMLQWAWFRENYPDIHFICPHWSHFQQFLTPMDYEDWIQYDLDMIEILAASGPGCVYRFPGKSNGADTECKLAKGLSVEVVYSDRQLTSWFMRLPQ